MQIGKTIALLVVLSAASAPVRAHSSVYCYQSSAGVKGGGSMKVSSFRIIVEQEHSESACRAIILSDNGQEIFRLQDWSVDVVPVTGKDINGEGHPDAVLESFSGGAHCCWTYFVVSLTDKGGLIRKFENRTPASFEDLSHNGTVDLVTQDGAFDEFEGLPHPFSPFPTIVLRLNRDKFEDVSKEFWPVYEKKIEQVRRDIKTSELERFIRSKPAEVHDDLDYLRTESAVLTVILEFLYGGRPEEAWKALGELWPSDDRERIRHAIINEYCGGLRSDLSLPLGPLCQAGSAGGAPFGFGFGGWSTLVGRTGLGQRVPHSLRI